MNTNSQRNETPFRFRPVIRFHSWLKQFPYEPPAILIIEDDISNTKVYESAANTIDARQKWHRGVAQMPRERPRLLVLDQLLSTANFGLDFLPSLTSCFPSCRYSRLSA